MTPLQRSPGRRRSAFVLAALLLGAALFPGGPLGLKVRMGFLYAPLRWFDAAPVPLDPGTRLRHENDALRAELAALRTEVAGLREFRGVKWEARSRPTRVIEARVLGRDRTSPLRRSLLVDAGTQDGLKRGQPVALGRCLAGFVEETGPSTALVRLLDDPGARPDDPGGRVGVRVIHPGAAAPVEGILVGVGKGSLLLRMVPAGTLAAGDLVVTSSTDPRVPAGLLVGKVGEVREDRKTRMAEATVLPEADLAGASALLVLVVPEAPPLAAKPGKGR